MPGTKRRIDEDLWLAQQLKKFKFSQVNANVYASTLAKLRQGSRNVFTSRGLDSKYEEKQMFSGQDADTSQGEIAVDVLMENEDADISICEDCTRNRQAESERIRISQAAGAAGILDLAQVQAFAQQQNHLTERCGFCEKNACHLNCCSKCLNEFCGSCCISSYDQPSLDTFICISCLR